MINTGLPDDFMMLDGSSAEKHPGYSLYTPEKPIIRWALL